jgi:hypothetical protein
VIEWENTERNLQVVKGREANLRRAVFEVHFDQPEEGTNTFNMRDGSVLKGTHCINRNFTDTDDLEVVLKQIEQMGNFGAFIADRLVNWKPSLAVGEYKELCDQAEKGDQNAALIVELINRVIVSKPGLPSLELVKEPKRRK